MCEFQRVPTWRPEWEFQRVPNWRPEWRPGLGPTWRPDLASRIGPVSARPELGVQRVPNELFIKVQVWGVGWCTGCIPARPDLGGSKTGYSSASRMGPFSLATHPEGSGKIGFWRIVGILGPGRVQIWQFLAIFSNLGDFASPGIPGNGGGGSKKGLFLAVFGGPRKHVICA